MRKSDAALIGVMLEAGVNITLGGQQETPPDVIVGQVMKVIPSSQAATCEMCGVGVWLSDGWLVHLRFPGVPILCLLCAVKVLASKES